MKTELLSGPAFTKDGRALGSTIAFRDFVPVGAPGLAHGWVSYLPSIIQVTKGLICRSPIYVNQQLMYMRGIPNQGVRRCMHEKWYSE